MRRGTHLGITFGPEGIRVVGVRGSRGKEKIVFEEPGKSLAEIVHHRGLKGLRASAAVPRSEIMMNWVPLSSLDRETQDSALLEAFPFPAEALVFHSKVWARGHGSSLMFSVAMPKERAEFYRQVIESAGLIFTGIGVVPLALIHGCRVLAGIFLDDNPAAILIIESTQAHLLVVQGKFLFSYRRFEISKRIEGDFSAIVREHLSLISKAYEIPKTKLIVLGSGIFWKENQDIEAQFSEFHLEKTEYAATDSLAAASQALGGPEGLRFFQPKSASSVLYGFFKSRRKEVASAAAAVLFIVFLLLQKTKNNLEARLHHLERDIALQQNILGDPNGGMSVIPLLVDLVNSVPNRVALKEFRLDLPSKTASGNALATSYSDVSELVERLSRAPGFLNVRAGKSHLVTTGSRSAVEFSIEATLK